ncbi:MAG: hypothetical protein P9L98_04935 [Candidatus Kaelpia imicola]|nr:hypothetical protein [Candidatus Kaelpia imicola]
MVRFKVVTVISILWYCLDISHPVSGKDSCSNSQNIRHQSSSISICNQNSISLRRERDADSLTFSILNDSGLSIGISWACFPDGEVNPRINNPEDIEGKDINLVFSPRNKTDFLNAILLLGTIKEYNPRSIRVKIDNWQPQGEYEDAMLYTLSVFADEVEGCSVDLISIERYSDAVEVDHFDHILCLDSRLFSVADELADEFNADSSRVLSVSDSLHWSLEGFSNFEDQDVIVVASTGNVADIIDLFSLLYGLRMQGVRTITLANTYQGYARQDKIFHEGEGISGYTVLKALNAFLDYNFAINVHYGEHSGLVAFPDRGDETVFNINAFPQLAEALYNHAREAKGVDGKTILLLAPDDGSFTYVKEAEVALSKYVSEIGSNVEIISGYLNKVRLDANTVAFSNLILTSDGELAELDQDTIVFLLDDETSTGMTVKIGMHYLVNILLEYNLNPGDIYAGIVHGKFVRGISDYLSRGPNYMTPAYTLCMDTLALPDDFQALSATELFKKVLSNVLSANYYPTVQSVP